MRYVFPLVLIGIAHSAPLLTGYEFICRQKQCSFLTKSKPLSPNTSVRAGNKGTFTVSINTSIFIILLTLLTDTSSQLLHFRRIHAAYHPLVNKSSGWSMNDHVIFQQCSLQFKPSSPRIILCCKLNSHNPSELKKNTPCCEYLTFITCFTSCTTAVPNSANFQTISEMIAQLSW